MGTPHSAALTLQQDPDLCLSLPLRGFPFRFEVSIDQTILQPLLTSLRDMGAWWKP